MRGTSNASVGRNESGEIFGISLGASFVAEHEMGIRRIFTYFGILPDKIGRDPVGIESRRIKSVPQDLFMAEFNKKVHHTKRSYSVGWVGTFMGFISPSMGKLVREKGPDELYEFYDGPGRTDDGEEDREPLSAGWSDGDFAVFARKPDDIAFLNDLAEAMISGDAAIWMGRGEGFRNAGLCFGIISRMPQELLDQFVEEDEIRLKTETADAATGIRDRLKAARDASGVQNYPYPFSYFALSPRLLSEEEQAERGTAHPVQYWLNPSDQENNNCGWYTVEELDQWIAGEGPIPGGRKARRESA